MFPSSSVRHVRQDRALALGRSLRPVETTKAQVGVHGHHHNQHGALNHQELHCYFSGSAYGSGGACLVHSMPLYTPALRSCTLFRTRAETHSRRTPNHSYQYLEIVYTATLCQDVSVSALSKIAPAFQTPGTSAGRLERPTRKSLK